MKRNIVIFSLEPLESRYTYDWFHHIPKLLTDRLSDKFNIIQIDGDTNSGKPTEGAFLDFISTNQWKNEQANKFFELVKTNKLGKGDHILFTDAWNPVIIEVKYVNDLMNMNWTLAGLWHAGAYDSNDFLGRLIGDTPWVRHTEEAFFYALDYSYFATEYHIDVFHKNLLDLDSELVHSHVASDKIVRTGWPMEYVEDTLQPYRNQPKRDLILFPHRLAPEKQLAIFKDLEKHLPQYEFVVCQEQELTKHEYYSLLGSAKMVFSASLQETLGISTGADAPLTGCIPLMPNRLSYTEMFHSFEDFLYPSSWTENWGNYVIYRADLIRKVTDLMDNYADFVPKIDRYINTAYPHYFHANSLINNFK